MNSSLPLEPASPSRDAAKSAPGWQKFHGRTTGRSVSVNLTQEEADLIRQRRKVLAPLTGVQESAAESWRDKRKVSNPESSTDGIRETKAKLNLEPWTEINKPLKSVTESTTASEVIVPFTGPQPYKSSESFKVPEPYTIPEPYKLKAPEPYRPVESFKDPAPPLPENCEEDPPPLPPKPTQKISKIGSPNSDQFIVMDNSALFSRVEEPGSKPEEECSGKLTSSSASDLRVPAISSDIITSPEPHSRSDSGLSSLSSWTAVSSSGRSGTSSVRSSSIVSNSSTKQLEELLGGPGSGGQKRSSSIVSSCSMKLEELNESEELLPTHRRRDSKVSEKVKFFQARTSSTELREDESVDLSSPTSKETGVQRQLATIKAQKERLIKEIVENEKVGLELQGRLEGLLPARELERYTTFLQEMEKVVLLMLSLCSRLERAEEELSCGNLTDWEKESIRYKRDKLEQQLKEAKALKEMSDRRQERLEKVLSKELGDQEVASFRGYVDKREELMRSQRACEEAEKSILPSIVT